MPPVDVTMGGGTMVRNVGPVYLLVINVHLILFVLTVLMR